MCHFFWNRGKVKKRTHCEWWEQSFGQSRRSNRSFTPFRPSPTHLQSLGNDHQSPRVGTDWMPQFPCHGWTTPKLQDGRLVCSGALDGPYKRSCSQCSLAVRMCLRICVLFWRSQDLPKIRICFCHSFAVIPSLAVFTTLDLYIAVFNWLGQQAGDLLSCSLDLKMAVRRRTWAGMFDWFLLFESLWILHFTLQKRPLALNIGFIHEGWLCRMRKCSASTQANVCSHQGNL